MSSHFLWPSIFTAARVAHVAYLPWLKLILRAQVSGKDTLWMRSIKHRRCRPPVAAGATKRAYLAACLALWGCGFAFIAIFWLFQWARMRGVRQSATVVSIPTGLKVYVPVMSAPDVIEPGIYGFLRPVLPLRESPTGCDSGARILSCPP